MEIFSLFKNEHFTNNNENKDKKIEHFMSGGATAGIIVGFLLILLIIGVVYYTKFRNYSSSIKYLTSSTSPEFNLTYTPNL